MYVLVYSPFWGAEGAPILFSLLGIRMASCWSMYVSMYTVFALLDAAATIYFARQFGAASIGERLLIESGVY